MAVKCGWASIGETGKGRNNKAGNQTGKELKIGSYYQFGQSAVYRWKNLTYAKRYAEAIKAMCENRHIGYDMNDRTTLFNALKKLGWEYEKLTTDVECDCSELVGCGINCVFKKVVISSGIYTGNLDELLIKTGYFEKLTAKKYLASDEYLRIGDIVNAPNHHVISVLSDGANAHDKSVDVALPTLRKGSKGAQVKILQKNLNSLGFKDSKGKKLEVDGEFGDNTLYALKAFQRKYYLVIDGVYGNKSYAQMKKVVK